MPILTTLPADGIRCAPAPQDAHHAQDAVARWQSHLDAGRLTAASGPQTTAHTIETRARNEAVIRDHAAARREALQSCGMWERE